MSDRSLDRSFETTSEDHGLDASTRIWKLRNFGKRNETMRRRYRTLSVVHVTTLETTLHLALAEFHTCWHLAWSS